MGSKTYLKIAKKKKTDYGLKPVIYIHQISYLPYLPSPCSFATNGYKVNPFPVQVDEVDGFQMVREMAAEVQIMMQHKETKQLMSYRIIDSGVFRSEGAKGAAIPPP